MKGFRLWLGIGALLLVIALPALYTAGGPRLGTIGGRYASPFYAADLRGHDAMVSPGEHGPCLLLFFCACQDCRTLARQLRESAPRQQSRGIQVVGIIHAGRDQAVSFLENTRFPGLLLVDPHHDIHERYDVGACPNAWLVNQGGTIHFSRRDPITPRELCRELETWLAKC